MEVAAKEDQEAQVQALAPQGRAGGLGENLITKI